jgi:hypothetical protein
LLEDFASRRSYSECCGILEAVYSLWTNFAPIADEDPKHPRLRKLSMKMTELRDLLKTNCISDIRIFSLNRSKKFCSGVEASDLVSPFRFLIIIDSSHIFKPRFTLAPSSTSSKRFPSAILILPIA